MVQWWKRLLISLLSMVLSAIGSLAVAVIYNQLKSQPVSIRSTEVILTAGVLVGFCLIAWVFSVPVVLLIKDVSGWRFWMYWIAGSCVGPLLMLVLCAAAFYAMPHSPSASWFNPAFTPFVYAAAAISSVTSLLYLSMLRWAQRRALATA